MKKIIIILVLIGLVFFAILTSKTRMSSTDQSEIENKEMQEVKVTTSNENDVTKDDSFTSIDSDLNGTVIMSEDFSDLK